MKISFIFFIALFTRIVLFAQTSDTFDYHRYKKFLPQTVFNAKDQEAVLRKKGTKDIVLSFKDGESQDAYVDVLENKNGKFKLIWQKIYKCENVNDVVVDYLNPKQELPFIFIDHGVGASVGGKMTCPPKTSPPEWV